MLLNQGYQDFSISRSYYAMFYVAQAFLFGKSLAFSKHSAVISAFGREFVKSGLVPPRFHSYLTDGEDSRKLGDYDFKHGLTKDDAKKQLDRAKEFLELASSLIGTNGQD